MDSRKIKELIELVERSAIAELEVHFFGGRKVIIRKWNDAPSAVRASSPPEVPPTVPAGQIPGTEQPQQPETSPATTEKPPPAEQKFVEITSPMVGTFYSKPSPESPPYVNVGEHISEGQVVCLIEAMKLFNEVKSEVSGKLVKVLVEDGSAVEFGQTLFYIEPD